MDELEKVVISLCQTKTYLIESNLLRNIRSKTIISSIKSNGRRMGKCDEQSSCLKEATNRHSSISASIAFLVAPDSLTCFHSSSLHLFHINIYITSIPLVFISSSYT